MRNPKPHIEQQASDFGLRFTRSGQLPPDAPALYCYQ